MPSSQAGDQVSDLIRALALGWRNLAAYPPGHPALVGSVDAAHRCLTKLRGPAGEVALGIASDGVLYGREKVDSTHAQKFAHALYSRGVAVVRFDAATEPSDIEKFLRLLGSPPGEKRPIWEELTAAGVVNINLQPVDYSAVQVTDDLSTPPAQKPEASSLWEEILQTLLAGHDLSPESRMLLTREVHSGNELAEMVFEYLRTIGREPETKTVFDPNATFGVRFQVPIPEPGQEADDPDALAASVAEAIGRQLARATGLRRQLAVQQAVQLLRTLPDPMRTAVLEAVLRVLATDETAGSLLKDFTGSLPSDEVLETLRYMATLPKISSHAMRLVESLVAIQKHEPAPQPVSAAAVEELVHLFAEEDIDRFNPEDHQALLETVSVQVPQVATQTISALETLGDRVETVTDEAVSRQMARILLELLERYGTSRPPAMILSRIESAFRSQLSSGQFAEALEVLERLQATTKSVSPLREPVQELLVRLANPETIQALVDRLHSTDTANTAVLQRLVEAMGSAAARNLLIALAEENNRSRRRTLFDFVASLGPVIIPEAVKFLSDSRWYVVRNIIVLLRTVNDRTSLAEVRRCMRHPDLRVRLEAIKSLLSFQTAVPPGLLEELLNDPDPKLAETAIALVGNYGIKEAVEPLLQILDHGDLFGRRRTIRLKAIKALGELAEPAALPRLQKFFSNSILPWPAREERRAAYESLSGYPREVRTAIAEQGARSRDPYIRDLSRRILGGK